VPAVILAAGEGRRLHPVTAGWPKPLVPLANVPLLYRLVGALVDAGGLALVANVHAFPEHLRAAARILDERDLVRLDLVVESDLTGPAGGLAACRGALPAADTYFVTGGDVATDIDPGAVTEFHRAAGADLTIVATTVPDPHRFGVLQLDGAEVTAIREKPVDAPADAVVSCGVYVLSARAMAKLAPGTSEYDFKHVVPELLAAGYRVVAYRTSEYWSDIGTPAAYLAANQRALRLHAPDSVAEKALFGRLYSAGEELPGGGQAAGPCLLGSGATAAPGSVLDGVVAGPDAVIGSAAVVRGSLLLPGAVVPAAAEIVDEVIV
jgi:NDP-sugar pyrophosphorylase family protein